MMNYADFAKKVIAQDGRNKFRYLDHNRIIELPASLRKFYIDYDPYDVEVRLSDCNSIRFYSLNMLKNLQKEYTLPKGAFVFATMNSDPIFISDGKIFTINGGCVGKPEALAASFDEYLFLIMENMQD